jgi:hypothetical protein
MARIEIIAVANIRDDLQMKSLAPASHYRDFMEILCISAKTQQLYSPFVFQLVFHNYELRNTYASATVRVG